MWNLFTVECIRMFLPLPVGLEIIFNGSRFVSSWIYWKFFLKNFWWNHCVFSGKKTPYIRMSFKITWRQVEVGHWGQPAPECLSCFGGSAWHESLTTNGVWGAMCVLWASGVTNSGFRNFGSFFLWERRRKVRIQR